MSKFIFWLKFLYRQKADNGGRIIGFCSASIRASGEDMGRALGTQYVLTAGELASSSLGWVPK